MDKLSDNLKKIFLAGIGAVAVTAEKSKDLLDEMVEKGELTVEQGRVKAQCEKDSKREGECAETGIGRGTFGSS